MSNPEFINGLGWVDDPEYNEWSDQLSYQAQEQQDEEEATRSDDQRMDC